MRDPNAQTLTNWRLVDEMRERREKNKMNHPISILIYPLFGGWRAECQACGAYGNSQDNKYKSNINVALDNLAKNEHAHSEKSKTCNHYYGNYKPRVNCYMDYNNLQFIKEPFTKKGCEKFPAIQLDNTIDISVFNAKNLTYEWSAYSYNRYIQKQELKEKEEKASAEANAWLSRVANTSPLMVAETKDIDDKVTSHSLYENLKTVSIGWTISILCFLIVGEALHFSRWFFVALFVLQIINVLCRGGLEIFYKKRNDKTGNSIKA